MTVKDSMRDFKEGIVYILKNKLLASLVFGYFIFGLVSGGLSVLPMFKMKYEICPLTVMSGILPSSQSYWASDF